MYLKNFQRISGFLSSKVLKSYKHLLFNYEIEMSDLQSVFVLFYSHNKAYAKALAYIYNNNHILLIVLKISFGKIIYLTIKG